jgi:2'-5' RNA ligase
MHGLVSLLPDTYYKKVEDLWQELEEKHGLKGIQVTPFPHFSWQIAEDYDLEKLKEIVEEITSETTPLKVHTGGIGIFTGAKPVIFISVVKSQALMKLHTKIWNKADQAGRGTSTLYRPDSWMPHISLAYEDVNESNIAAVMEGLFFRPFSWEMDIDNIAFIYEPNGSIGQLKFQYKFTGSPPEKE